MPLQSDDFRVLGLGVRGDVPPDGVQPPLADGIHLRWAFTPRLGFPWHGVYIFRRGHEPRRARCIRPQLATLTPQTWPDAELNLPDGVITGDAALQLTDDFPPPGVELDLRNGQRIRYRLRDSRTAYRADVTIGFRAAARPARRCLRFRGAGQRANPIDFPEAKLTLRDAQKRPAKQAIVEIVEVDGVRELGVDVGPSMLIELASAQTAVELLMLVADPDALKIDTPDDSRAKVAFAEAEEGKPRRVSITGRALRTIVVTAGARALLLELCVLQPAAARQQVEVVALSGEVEVAREVVSGAPGDTVPVTLIASSITAIRVGPGNAALLDLCTYAIEDDARDGWDQFGDFRFPLCLPITHPDYPCSGNAPVDAAAAEARALGRVRYGPTARWGGQAFADLHQALVTLVAGGPAGPPMAEKLTGPIPGVAVPPDPNVPPPALPPQRVLDLVLLASIHPAFSQMVALYFIDQWAQPGSTYDYLVVADYEGVGRGSDRVMLQHIRAFGFDRVHAAIAYGLRAEAAAPLERPREVRAYALPGGTLARQGGGPVVDAANNAGLRWDLGLLPSNLLATRAPVVYHIWRAALGNGNLPVPGAPADIITKPAPILVPQSLLAGETPQRPDDWPPFPLWFLDRGLADGWYAYHVTGVDLFGRHSVRSDPAEWRQWTPEPDPTPWYYAQPPSDAVIHPSAVRLLDMTRPPPPVGVEAHALAPVEAAASPPEDPLIVRDAPFVAWSATLTQGERESIVGLRVRWRWELPQMRQAPNVREFRIYYQSGLANVLSGRITNVTPSGATSVVRTDIANARAANAFTGATLQIGQNGFPIIGSDAGAPLQFRVENRGLTESAGTVIVTNGLAVVTGTGTHWHPGMNGLSLQVTGDTAVYSILRVESETRLILTQVYAGVGAPAAAYTIFDLRPTLGPCTIVLPATYNAGSVSVQEGSANVTGTNTRWHAGMAGMRIRIEGSSRRYRVASVGSATQLVLDRLHDGATGENRVYTIVFPLYTDYAEPPAFQRRLYVVGYDDHVQIAPDGTRHYEVFLPQPGDADRDGIPLVPTQAEPIVYALIGVSAADQKPHSPDHAKWVGTPFGNRPGNEGPAGGPSTIFRVRRVPPDPPLPAVTAPRLYATPADYHSRSYYTFRWRSAGPLKANVYRALDDALFAVDWVTMRARADLDPANLASFPSEALEPRWNLALRQRVAGEVNAIRALPDTAAGKTAAMAAYRALSDDALRLLAGLEGNDRAFVLLNTEPLDPDAPASVDRRGPDDPDNYAPNALFRAYLDTLDGRATNRYLYRAAYVDSVGNAGPLGPSGSPVWLPDVVPPRAPVIVRVLGGERQITVAWASNREVDLAAYRLYRADTEAAARDLRLMALVREEGVGAGDPAARPGVVSFTDEVPGLKTFFYRLVAVDATGNVSAPSAVVSGRGFDDAPPAAIAPQVAWVADPGGTVRAQITWNSGNDETLLQRKTGSFWTDLGTWSPPGAFDVRDESSDPARAVTYRVWTRKYTGAITRGAPVELAPQ